jgi:hypothetical protein
MLSVILLGSLALMVNMLIQVSAVVVIVGYIIRLVNSDRLIPTIGRDMGVMSTVLLFLFFSHLVQFASWALLFMYLGEFSDFNVAYYHSVVNFTSLGYGDIVMSEQWRLLGALEAANGILMFGLTTSTFVAVMNRLFTRYKPVAQAWQKEPPGDHAANS